MLNIKTFPVNMVEENTYVVFDESREAVIIDCGALFKDEQEEIGTFISDNGLRVVRLLNTHGHFDHVFGCQWASETYNVLPELHTKEKQLYLSAAEDMVRFLRRRLALDLPPIGRCLNDGDIVNFGNHHFEIIFTPGHTPGGISLYCSAEKVLFSGDSLFRGSIGRCDLPGGDLDTLIDSIKSRLLTLPDDTIVYPGHGSSTTIGFERMQNPYL